MVQMTLGTCDEYIKRLKKKRPNVYMGGEKVDRMNEVFRPGINTICLTYEQAHDPEYEDICTAKSHLTGDKINRFCHIHQSKEDLLKKQELVRSLCRLSGGCIQRCMGNDAINALSIVTKEIDMKYNTNYNQRFINFLKYFQENSLVGNCAQTDVKGDRTRRPHEQEDLDLYLRVIEKRDDGIVVRGAKAHNTTAPYADEIIAVPTRNLTKEEGDWAVAFAIPADHEGVKLVCTPMGILQHKILKNNYATYAGGADSLTIFDDVFVPSERIFMCGEWEFGRKLALHFANFHRHSYTGCKPGVTDVLCGTAALVAEYNNIEHATHVREKLSEYVGLSELVYSAGVASAIYAKKSSAGTYFPDPACTNAGRRIAGENIYHEYENLVDLAGGLAATLPKEEDFAAKETGELLKKYIRRNPKISSEDVQRCFSLVKDIAALASGYWQIGGLHGGGSPIMETIVMMAQYKLEPLKDIARYLAGIGGKPSRIKREDLVSYTF